MKVYDAGGGALGLRHDAAEEARYPLPAGAAAVEFDPETNAALAADLGRGAAGYALAGGALAKDGQPVALAAAGSGYSEAADLRATGQQAIDGLTSYLGLASPTAAQTASAVKLLCRVVRYFVRRELARLG